VDAHGTFLRVRTERIGKDAAASDTVQNRHACKRQQATNNTEEQFANSPDLTSELTNAILNALAAHTE